MSDASAPLSEPDYGAVDAAFPLWAAKEAKEAIIKRLDAQNAAMTAYEARATSWLGWLSGIVIAVLSTGGARLLASSPGGLTRGQTIVLLASALIPAAFSALYLSSVFRVKQWFYNYGDIGWLTTEVPEHPSELEILQHFALAGQASIASNDRVLRSTYEALTAGRRWFIALPAGLVLTSLVLMVVISVVAPGGGAH